LILPADFAELAAFFESIRVYSFNKRKQSTKHIHTDRKSPEGHVGPNTLQKEPREKQNYKEAPGILCSSHTNPPRNWSHATANTTASNRRRKDEDHEAQSRRSSIAGNGFLNLATEAPEGAALIAVAHRPGPSPEHIVDLRN
jgi:hypothetical protein